MRAKTVVFGQQVVVTWGYRSCAAMPCGATVTTALTHQPAYVALISTYTRVHTQLLRLSFVPRSHSLSLSSGR